MKLTSLFFAFVLFGVLTSPAWAADWSGGGVWNAAGFRGNGHGRGNLVLASGIAPAGQTDPRTAVTSSNQSAVACSNIQSGWAHPIGRSNWVSLQADCTAGLGVGDYTYSTTFNLPANRPGQSLSGLVLSDDSVTIQLNGHTILNNGGNFVTPTAFSTSDSTFFNTGSNTLTFIVHNSGGPSGLDYVARVHPGRGNANAQQSDDDNDDSGD